VTAAGTVAAQPAAATGTARGPGRRKIDDRELLGRFPPRAVPAAWPVTLMGRDQVWGHLIAAPFPKAGSAPERARRRGMAIVLGWLAGQPGGSWQDRWLATGAEADPAADWRLLPLGWKLRGSEGKPRQRDQHAVAPGLLSLIAADVLRPGLPWLLGTQTPKFLAAELARVRDPAGFAAVSARARAAPVNLAATGVALHRIAAIVAAKGGGVAGICTGDCLELLTAAAGTSSSWQARSPYFYQLLHAAGMLEASAPPTIRMARWRGQPAIEELIGKCGIQCRPVRDLLVAYLAERQPALDFSALRRLADDLGRLFWRDLELRHPGIDSLHLSAEAATAWKQRIQVKPARSGEHPGSATEPRINADQLLVTVRTFYADIAQWAADDPGRWAAWVAPNPVKDTAVALRKTKAQRKSRMDQRTRERLPAMPALLAHVRAQRTATARRLAAAAATTPGELFTSGGVTLRRTITSAGRQAVRVWAEDPASGVRADLTAAEDNAFWTWACTETLNETGIRVEELGEISHHSLIQYHDDATGQVIPLLHIAPSKTDQERLVVISPVLTGVLGAVISRIRGATGAVPCVRRYDRHERKFDDATVPLLFQRRFGVENRPIPYSAVRLFLEKALAAAGITDGAGQPLTMQPHDFRRIFITEAISNGMPPHICQLIAGHKDINVTMNYNTIYPQQAINAHREFIARRRALRPADEYRPVTDAEWDEFRGHFARRKVALGDCGRAYGTPCAHENACLRCPLLRPDPAEKLRLAEIILNLAVRIEEAQDRGQLGEVEGRKADLAAAKDKLAQMDYIAASRRATADLGMPAFAQAAPQTITASSNPDHA
jgi:integrase